VDLKKFQWELGIKDSDFEKTPRDLPSSTHPMSREKRRRNKGQNRRTLLPELNVPVCTVLAEESGLHPRRVLLQWESD
jgi:hypothetical protein